MASFSDRRRAGNGIAMDILPPEDGKAKVIPLRRKRGEVEDAHFVPVTDRRRRTARGRSDNDNATTASRQKRHSGKEMATFASILERRLMRLSPDTFLALVAAIFVAVFTLCGGFSLISDGQVRNAQAGPALDITHVTMTPQDANGMRVLLINGIVENRSEGHLPMPAIRADLLLNETVLASTFITTEALQIGGRESYGFSARVPHPGGKLPDLRLSLADRGA